LYHGESHSARTTENDRIRLTTPFDEGNLISYANCAESFENSKISRNIGELKLRPTFMRRSTA
jgi:hypothetical protein